MEKRITVSFCIPLYNEEQTLLKSLTRIELGLAKTVGPDNFEIVLVDNGSTDSTRELLKQINNPHIKVFYINKKGQGLAYKKCIKEAVCEYILLSAIDLPFGFGDLEQFLDKKRESDIIFGSKNHPYSKIKVPLTRKVTSFIYNALLSALFRIKIRDTQGTVFAKKSSILKILPLCDAQNAFFTAQIAIYAQKYRLSVTEIPVKYNAGKKGARKSRYNIPLDGSKMLNSLLKEFVNNQFFNKPHKRK